MIDIREAYQKYPNDTLGALQYIIKDNPDWEQDELVADMLASEVTEMIKAGALPQDAMRALDNKLTLTNGKHLLSRANKRKLASRAYSDVVTSSGLNTGQLRFTDYDRKGTPIIASVTCTPEGHYEAYEADVMSAGGALFGFGIPALDSAFGYLAPGELMALVGAPGSFKTSLALSAAEDALKDASKSVMLFSLDMPPERIMARRLMRELGCSEQQLDALVRMRDEELSAARGRMLYRDAERFTIVGGRREGPYSWKQIEELTLQKGPDLLIIDYLTRIGCYNSELSCVRDLMPKISKFAADYSIATILLSQMSRTSRADQRDKSGGHAAGGHYVEDVVDVEIELQVCRHDDNQDIVATVAKTRKCASGKSFFLTLKGAQLSFDLDARQAERRERPKNIFEGKL